MRLYFASLLQPEKGSNGLVPEGAALVSAVGTAYGDFCNRGKGGLRDFCRDTLTSRLGATRPGVPWLAAAFASASGLILSAGLAERARSR